MTTLLHAERLGERRPRLHRAPRYASSAGQEAIDLAASVGLILDPWQGDVLTDALGEKPNGNWAAFEVGLITPRQNGKDAILEARELFGLFLAREQLITYTAHLFATSLEAFRRVKYWIESSSDLSRKVKRVWETTGREGIEILPRFGGSRLRFMARSKGSGRGFAGDVVFWNEAFALEEEHVDALMPTMSARPNPQVWYVSSPPLDAVSGAPLFRLRERAQSPNPGALVWADWSSPNTVDPNDLEALYAANPAMGYRITEEFVSAERRSMSPEGYARERLCVWPLRSGQRWSVLSEADWLAAEDPTTPAQPGLVLALHVSPESTHASINAAWWGEKDVHAAVFDHQPGLGWLVGRTVELVAKWKVKRVGYDPACPVGSKAPELAEALKPFNAELVAMKTRDVCVAFGIFRNGIASEPDPELTPIEEPDDEVVAPQNWRLKIRPHPALSAAAESAATRYVGASKAWEWKTPHDQSTLLACTNAVWTLITSPEDEGAPTPWVIYA